MRMSTKTFHSLRYFTQIILPAIATFITTICGVWDCQFGVNLGLSISAVIALLSGILGASSAIYDKEGGYDDGNIKHSDSGDLHSYVHISCRSTAEEGSEEEQRG